MLNRSALQEAFFRQLHGDDAGAICGLLVVRALRLRELELLLGHALVESLSDAVEARLRGLLRPDDELVRIGECDFGVVLPCLRERNHAALAASKVARGLNGMLDVRGRPIRANVAVGAASWPADADSFETLCLHADQACAAAAAGREHFALFSGGGRSQLVEYNELHAALAGNQLHLHLQPIHDIASGVLVGFEALSRWDNPRLGPVRPDHFIGLAEQTGLRYRLPSEAEFEYVLRAGGRGRYPWGDGAPPRGMLNTTGGNDRSPGGRPWANAFEGYGDGHWGPAPVGSLVVNPWGLHDLSGNVSEWVADCWHDSFRRAPKDGSAWVNPGCRNQVIRGGSWASSPAQTRSAWRAPAQVDTTNARLGFRVVRDL